MTDLRKAAEMALAKLDHLWEIAVDERMNTDVLPEIKALRQALAQPEQEQYVTKVVAVHEDGTYTLERIPLPKREWQGLTEEKTKEILLNLPIKWTGHLQGASSIYDFARAIEAKLKEENT